MTSEALHTPKIIGEYKLDMPFCSHFATGEHSVPPLPYLPAGWSSEPLETIWENRPGGRVLDVVSEPLALDVMEDDVKIACGYMVSASFKLQLWLLYHLFDTLMLDVGHITGVFKIPAIFVDSLAYFTLIIPIITIITINHDFTKSSSSLQEAVRWTYRPNAFQ
ncbi:hypothetical protein GQ44DRAFT_760430 [Phaeosphaeriaceae sp. PMI808]|nr:hypothetical protein GQ44DRAFT_760430 [Phaeosphaeriaceae sp. PMI808]